MKQWEYKVLETNASVEEQLNELGKQGFDIVSVIPIMFPQQTLFACKAMIVLKKELEIETDH